VLPLDLVKELHQKLESIMRIYWKGWKRVDADSRHRMREIVARHLPKESWLLHTLMASSGPIITDRELFSEWPQLND
jgi:hypothetical protein